MPRHDASPGRAETPSERADRNFAEAVQELDFPASDTAFAAVYTAALLCAAGAAVTFIAPVAFHRLHFRRGLKEGVVWLTHRMSLLGLVLLVAAMALAVWLVMTVLWSATAAAAAVVAMLVTVLLLWVLVPRLILRDRG